jgi:hypothetical protein
MLAALALAAPISLGQYRKVKVISLANILEVRDSISPDKDKSTLLEAARKVAQNCDNMTSYRTSAGS